MGWRQSTPHCWRRDDGTAVVFLWQVGRWMIREPGHEMCMSSELADMPQDPLDMPAALLFFNFTDAADAKAFIDQRRPEAA